MDDRRLLNVPRSLRRGTARSEELWLDSARRSLDLLCEVRGTPDLATTRVLDVGCGTKLVKVLIEEERPIRRYIGVDVEPEVIDFLHTNVTDRRFSFTHIDVYNELYNPRGTPLSEMNALPIGSERFDVICLFSVFTHLAPEDYRAMLEVLREHAAPDCRLVFSLFINRDRDPRDSYAAFMGSEARAKLEAAIAARIAAGDEELQQEAAARERRRLEPEDPSTIPAFVDLVPDEPLLVAAYSEPYARSLIDGTGWRILELRPPLDFIQHHFVCAPEPSTSGEAIRG